MGRQLSRLAAAAALIATAIVLCVAAITATRGRQLADEGRRLLLEGRASEAASVLEGSVGAFPSSQGLSLLARARLLQSDRAAAEAALRRAIPLSASPADPMRLLGGILSQTRGRESEAADWMWRAARLAPVPRAEAPSFRLNLGLALLETHQTEKALQSLHRSLEAGEASPLLGDGLADAYEALGLAAAREAYSSAFRPARP